jgi:hypothetical protein
MPVDPRTHCPRCERPRPPEVVRAIMAPGSLISFPEELLCNLCQRAGRSLTVRPRWQRQAAAQSAKGGAR